MTPTRPSRRWRAFAILMLILVLPSEFAGLFRHPSAYDAMRYAIDTIAVIGLVGYAYARPMGSPLLWRIFAPVFILFTIALFVMGMPRLIGAMTAMPGDIGRWIGLAIGLLLLLTIPGFLAIALLRHGGWLQGTGTAPVDLRATFS